MIRAGLNAMKLSDGSHVWDVIVEDTQEAVAISLPCCSFEAASGLADAIKRACIDLDTLPQSGNRGGRL